MIDKFDARAPVGNATNAIGRAMASSAAIPPLPLIDVPFQKQEKRGVGAFDWLENSRDSSERLDAWIEQHNARTMHAILRDSDIADLDLYKECLAVLGNPDKVPFVGCEQGGYVYNYWQDKINVRGLWRRTTLEQYRQPNTTWENLLDIDAFNKKEGTSWAGDSAWCWQAPLPPDYKSALVTMSPGGNDKTHLFEFDLSTKQFKIPMDQGGDGFSIRDEAKMSAVAYDQDTIYVATPLPDYDEWGGVTESTYARVLTRWRRGVQRDYKSAEVVLEIPREFMWIFPEVDTWRYAASGVETKRVLIDTRPSFYKHRIVHHDPVTNESVRLALPDEITEPYMSYFDYYVVTLRDARWGFAADSLLVCYLSDLLELSRRRQAARAVTPADILLGEVVLSDEDAARIFFPLFTPTASTTLCYMVALKDFIVLACIDDVKSKLIVWECCSQTRQAGVPILRAFRPSAVRTPWSEANFDVVSAFSRHPDGSSNEMFVQSYGFLKPTTIELIDLASAASAAATGPVPLQLKASPHRFDASGMSVQQHLATSADGTKVPFFVVGRDLDTPQPHARPLLLYGYGAHGVVVRPHYLGIEGKLWLSRGGLYAVANIRGGGEYGFRWHEAGAPNRLKAYEDFESVASHLVHQLRLTATDKLACIGDSMGGLLTANMLTRDNGLFKAVVSECPLADLERFRFLGMGHSWMPELGDPSTPDGWRAVQQYSPLHRITPPAERRFAYPRALFVASSNDDRTHPAHGRKMVAKMDELVGESAAGALLLEEAEGGHGGNADIEQVARQHALIFSFLWQSLAPETRGETAMETAPSGGAKRQRTDH